MRILRRLDLAGACFILHGMYLATVNKSRQLLVLSMIGQVRVEEMARERESIVAMVGELSPGFTVLTDLERVESIGLGCEKEIGKTMELCDQKDVGLVIRVIPHPSKDIGFNIIAMFHYRKQRRSIQCESMLEAVKLLEAQPPTV